MDKIEKILLLLAKSAMIAFFLVAICTYIYFCPPVLTSLNGGFILFPFKPGEEYNYDTLNGIKSEDVYFKNNLGNKLHGWFFQSPKAGAPVILFSHGNAGNIGNRLLLVQHLLNTGASVFIYDYREFGNSEGTKSLSGLLDDAESAYDYLTKERKVSASDIVLYGESIGGGPTCMLASKHETAGIILDSCFTSLIRIGKKKVAAFNMYPDFLAPIPPLDNITILRAKHAPLLIMHGKLDEVIPISEAEDNFAAALEPKTILVLPASTHNCKDPDFALHESGIKEFLSSLKIVKHS